MCHVGLVWLALVAQRRRNESFGALGVWAVAALGEE
jgi:hypothetical protein